MGLLYDVTYPGRADFDPDVPYAYLRHVGKDPKNNGANAACTNGPWQVLVLRDGAWEEVIPEPRPAPGGRT